MRELIFSGIMISCLFAILFFTRRGRIYSDYLFGMMFILGAGILLFLFFQAAGFNETAMKLQLVIAGFPQLTALLFYAAVKFITSDNRLPVSRWLILLLPVFMFYLVLLAVYCNGRMISSSRILSVISTLFLTLFNVSVVVICQIVVLEQISKYRKYMATRVSNFTHISLAWIELYAGLGLVAAGLSCYMVLFYLAGLLSLELANSVISVYSVISLCIIVYFGFRSGNVFTMIIRPELHKEKYGPNRLDEPVRHQHAAKLGAYMSAQKPFLNPYLTINDVAKATGIPVNDLSQVLNDHLNRNFFDYVNRFRVDEVIRMIERGEGKQFSLLGLALESGFNSKSNFNRVFKKVTGKTPSRFYQEYHGKKKS